VGLVCVERVFTHVVALVAAGTDLRVRSKTGTLDGLGL
jgi:hypothetical protein